MTTVNDLRVQRCDVFAISSEEALRLMREMPELVGMAKIEGMEIIMVTRSLDDVVRDLSKVVTGLSTKPQHILIVKRSGICVECAMQDKKDKICKHLGISINSINSSYDVDVSKIPKMA